MNGCSSKMVKIVIPENKTIPLIRNPLYEFGDLINDSA